MLQRLPLALAVLAAAAAVGVEPAAVPHFVTIIADDLGHFDTTLYNEVSPTPNIAVLAKGEGVILDRAYAFRYCSPTRRSLLSGRFPNHITGTQAPTCSNYLPLEFTILSEKLKDHTSHFIGKGHLGYQTTDHLPINRGFQSHVGYLGGSEGYSHGGGSANATQGSHDMWHDHLPGIDIVPEIEYSANFYTERAVNVIKAHDKSTPLWLHLTYQNVHAPYVNPPDWEVHKYPRMWDNVFANMLNMLDSGIGNVTQALKDAGLWDNTLIVFSADNGGIGPANNHPLRGHKHDAWEGGTRVSSFISGGFVPEKLKGTRVSSVVHICDWYATMCELSGVDPTDDAMFEGKVRPIDAVNVWPMLVGDNATQPRPWTPTSEYGLLWENWKLVTLAGQSNYYTNDSQHINPPGTVLPCLTGAQPHPSGTDNPVSGCVVCNSTVPCLFDVEGDPTETTNVAKDHPDVVAKMAAILASYQPYGDFEMTAAQLAKYTKIDKPNEKWSGYAGPCYERP